MVVVPILFAFRMISFEKCRNRSLLIPVMPVNQWYNFMLYMYSNGCHGQTKRCELLKLSECITEGFVFNFAFTTHQNFRRFRAAQPQKRPHGLTWRKQHFSEKNERSYFFKTLKKDSLSSKTTYQLWHWWKRLQSSSDNINSNFWPLGP